MMPPQAGKWPELPMRMLVEIVEGAGARFKAVRPWEVPNSGSHCIAFLLGHCIVP
jgi:hypothetical protein